MNFAFANFNEPHAWLIRGLVEYGWRDVTRIGGTVPDGAPGAFMLSHLLETQGREAMMLLVRAEADGMACPDGIYEIEVDVIGSMPNIKVVLRCPECNYLEEFPYDPVHPTHVVGYIHEALLRYVQEFVRWRLLGNELGWSQRAGLPEIHGDPCSADLARFVRDQLNRAGFTFDLAPTHGWWLGIDATARNAVGPVATVGKGGGDPVYVSAAGRAALAKMGGMNASVERVTALDLVESPASWLKLMVYGCMSLGGIALVYAIYVLFAFGTGEVIALAVNSLLGVGLLAGGGLSLVGVKRYREVRASPLVYVPIVYCALAPACCLVGLPISAWALLVWLKPAVQAGRI